ncbi:MAG: sulfate permease [Deltaproteobacteria bacterium]
MSSQAAARRADLIAGVTTAVLLVPQAMAYALLAGLPPQVGLYAASVPLLVYAALGSSPRLAIGPVALDSLMLAAAVTPLARATGASYLGLALLLTCMVGALQVLLGLGRLGFVANFLSRPVLSGFTSAAALLIASSQLGPLTGLSLPSGRFDEILVALPQRLDALHGPTLAFGLPALLGSLWLSTRFKRFPSALFLVVLGTLAAAAFHADRHGVALVGSVPAGLPHFASPLAELGSPWAALANWRALAPAAASIALISFVESLSVGRRLAGPADVDPNRELVAVGAANFASGWFGGYVVAGGLSRSALHARAGAQSRFAGVVTALVVALTLAFFTPLFRYLPKAVLAALVLNAVVSLIDVAHARRLWVVQRSEFWLLLITFAATLALGAQLGLGFGVASSLVLFLVRTTRPHVAILGRLPDTESYRNINRFPEAERSADPLILRVDAQFYFGNVTFLKRSLDRLCRERPGLRTIILDASGINQLDSSALDALIEIDRALQQQKLRLLFAEVKGPVRDVLERSGWLAHLQSEQRIFLRVHDAVLSLGTHGESGCP